MPDHRIAIYDLDQTLTRHATYTPFLAFAARRLGLWRLGLLAVWVVMMLGHKAGLYGRARLKQAGFRLIIGRADDARLPAIVGAFADRVIAAMPPAARAQWDGDGARGTQRVIATAAIDLYARAIATRLDADHLVATPVDAAGRLMAGNNYGDVKHARVLAWFAASGRNRATTHITVYSDHPSDAPLLDWADDGVLVTHSAARRAMATRRGWRVADFSDRQ